MQKTTPLGSYSIFRYLRKSIFYCFSIGTEAIISAALLPILTSKITPEDYGKWILFVALFSFMRPIVGLMLQDAIRLKYYKVKDKQLLRLLQSAIILPTAFLFVLLGVIHFFGDPIASFFSFPGEFLSEVLFTAYLHGLFYTLLALMQFRGSHAMFLAEQVSQTVLAIVATVTLLSLGFSWQSAVYARMFALIFANLIGLAWLIKKIGNPFSVRNSKSSLYKLWKIGIQFLPVGLAGVIIPLTDRVVVTKFIGSAETSFFGIGALFSSLLLIIVSGLIFAWQPRLFAHINDKNSAGLRELKQFKMLYFCGLPLAAVCVVICSNIIVPYLASYKNDEINVYILWLTVAALAQGFYQYNHTWLHATSQLKVIALTALFIIITNVVLNVYLVSNYGGIGAAWATGTSYLLAAVGTGIWLMTNKKAIIK